MCFLYRRGNSELTLAYAKFDQANQLALKTAEPYPILVKEVKDSAHECKRLYNMDQRFYVEGWCHHPDLPLEMPFTVGHIVEATTRMDKITQIAQSIADSAAPTHSCL